MTKLSCCKLFIRTVKLPALSAVCPTPEVFKYTEAKGTGSLVCESIIFPVNVTCACKVTEEKKIKQKKRKYFNIRFKIFRLFSYKKVAVKNTHLPLTVYSFFKQAYIEQDHLFTIISLMIFSSSMILFSSWGRLRVIAWLLRAAVYS